MLSDDFQGFQELLSFHNNWALIVIFASVFVHLLSNRCANISKLFAIANFLLINFSNMSKIDIKAFRKANRLSQKMLAEYLGVGQGFISQIEAGERPLPMNLLDKILANPEWDISMIIPERESESELISALKETIQSQRETIDYQKEIIAMLKSERRSPGNAASDNAHSAYSAINP